MWWFSFAFNSLIVLSIILFPYMIEYRISYYARVGDKARKETLKKIKELKP